MKTKELIEFLRKNKTKIDLWEEVIDEIIKRLEGYNELMKENRLLREKIGHWF